MRRQKSLREPYDVPIPPCPTDREAREQRAKPNECGSIEMKPSTLVASSS